MLTTNEWESNISEYSFKSSPESFSDGSLDPEFMDIGYDGDFLTQLSSDLDIPLFLNAGQDEMNLLNSFLDKSPEEILSEAASSPNSTLEDIACDFDEFDLKDQKPIPCNETSIKIEDIPKINPVTNVEVTQKFASTPHRNSTFKINNKTTPVSIKTEPIKTECSSIDVRRKVFVQSPVIEPKKEHVILVKNEIKPIATSTNNNIIILNSLGSNTIAPFTPVRNITPVTQTVTVKPLVINDGSIPTSIPLVNSKIDLKLLKKQQRKIKNRESACLSRKKKKDYVASLEETVQNLTIENDNLKKENENLKARLSKYENNAVSSKTKQQGLVLCLVLFMIGVNMDFIRNPLSRGDLYAIRDGLSKATPHHGRNLLWISENKDTSNITADKLSMCPAAVNQTESVRLALELERWIGKPINLNTNTKVPTTKPELSVTAPIPKKKARRRKHKFISSLVSIGENPNLEMKNEIQVFSPTVEQLYSEFFEAINRQDDTFYVVSFSKHHMLLPALYHNNTRRPRMSLIMPSVLLNDTSAQTAMPLMQIDCEVLDTKLLHIKYGSIPQKYREYKSNMTNQETVNSKTDKQSKGYYKGHYRPFFINKRSLKTRV